MKLDNLLALTGGELQNSPVISEFDDIAIRANRVKRGSLFVAINPFDIQEALERGAYGIVYDREDIATDEESAWIRVTSIYEALKRIIRFLLIDKELHAYQCDLVTLDVAKHFSVKNAKLIILEGSLSDNFNRLLGATKGSLFLFERSNINNNVFADALQLPPAKASLSIVKETLFQSKFIYKERLYEIEQLAPLFITQCCSLIDLLQEHGLEFTLRSFKDFAHFQPVFVSRTLHVKEFGESEKVLIFEKNPLLFNKEIAYLLQSVPWAKTLLLLPQSFGRDDVIVYNMKSDIFRLLVEKEYNFAYIGGFESSLLDEAEFAIEPKQLTFDME